MVTPHKGMCLVAFNRIPSYATATQSRGRNRKGGDVKGVAPALLGLEWSAKRTEINRKRISRPSKRSRSSAVLLRSFDWHKRIGAWIDSNV